MLLRRIYFYTDGACIIFVEEILNRIHMVLTHIAQSTSVIIPVSPEVRMNPIFCVWFILLRAQPHSIILFFRYRLWASIGFSTPGMLPVNYGRTADRHFERPAKHPILHQFFNRLYRYTHSVKLA